MKFVLKMLKKLSLFSHILTVSFPIFRLKAVRTLESKTKDMQKCYKKLMMLILRNFKTKKIVTKRL